MRWGLGRKSASPYGALGPPAFVRSGWINVSTTYDGNMRYVGNAGYNRSRTVQSSTSVYHLYTNTMNVNSSDVGGLWLGFPLRCLYPGSA